MDGFEENDRIIVVAATNLVSSLDPALSRPGRFDHKIEIKLPDTDDRKEIIKIHLRNKTNSVSDAVLQKAAEASSGLAGAELENIINLATLNTIRKARINKESSSVLNGDDFLSFV
jgi:cell division protease FtsH